MYYYNNKYLLRNIIMNKQLITFCYVMCNADTGLCDFIKIHDIFMPSPLGTEHDKKIGVVSSHSRGAKLF